MEANTNQFSIDGRSMSYLDVGTGPVILFGHSYLWDCEMWRPQIEVLSRHYRCIVPDFWAHGRSEAMPEQTRTLKDYAGQMLALMDHLAVERFALVGLSVGGMWGCELVSLAPQRVTSLVLMDTFVGLEPEVNNAKYFAMLETIAMARLVPTPIIEAVTPLFFAKSTLAEDSELVRGFTAKLAQVKDQQAVELARIGRMIFGRRDQMEEVERFALPTLIAVGQQDMARPVLESYLMHDAITGSQLVQIADAGHISNLEQPERVTQLLADFLAQYHPLQA
ncbi:alpha/beta fold hydrolase [Vibrio sp.]|uniref:alpha/beta fold hydrolase n=1 Tax=Vibrio sp. TaxID=678 RepID=UPI003D139475